MMEAFNSKRTFWMSFVACLPFFLSYASPRLIDARACRLAHVESLTADISARAACTGDAGFKRMHSMEQ